MRTLMSTATFANGLHLQMWHIEEQTSDNKTVKRVELYNPKTNDTYPATDAARAWFKMRYIARINQTTENTTGWKGYASH